MVKSSKETMKKDTIKVLDVLEQDAKENIDEIAKKCGFSRQKVWRIIKQLEENKTIWGYTAVTDEEAKNLKHYIVLVNKNNEPFDDLLKKEVMYGKLDENPSGLVKIENIYFIHGTYDLVITFYAPDLISAKKFVEITFHRLNKYVKSYVLCETLFPLRKQGLKNPQIKKLAMFL